MDFLKLAQERRSVRAFKTEVVSDELVNKILEAGRLAPTACNKQPQRIIAVRSGEGLARLRRSTECHYNAPLAFIVSYDRTECWTRPFDGKSSGDIDASIVATHMMMEAAELGVGSTWVMFFDPAVVRKEFQLPDDQEPSAILVMGYPKDGSLRSGAHTPRKPINETVTFR